MAAEDKQRRVPPMISLPTQSSFENLFTGGPGPGPGFSPGPMTLVSNFFTDHYPDVDCRSFSQLLAGAMASPAAVIDDAKQSDDKKPGGFKQNRPVDLVIAQSPSGFMFPSVFSPSGFLNSPGFFSPLQSPFGMSHQQALAHVTAQAALSQSYFNTVQPETGSLTTVVSEVLPLTVSSFDTKTELDDSQIGSPDVVSQSDITETQQIVSIDTKDGYNWRKYGQKQVKASERPRSYYKCTHANCPVKKKVGQSLDGHITDIVYKGQHNHEPPQPSKRGNKEGADVNKLNNSQLVKRVVEEPMANRMISADQGSNQLMRTNQGSNQLIRIDEPDDEPNPKRRNTEVGPVSVPVDSSSAHKMVSEPKIVVQTRSEVDLLDDGFKWRKYGQKVVKGNTNPRSYYKCTYAGCNVRKHVERAPSDPKSVVTTYEGKHNHDIPVARHRGYNNNGGQNGKSTKPSQSKGTTLGNNERPVLLQMKEEEITA
ncbi:putative WRKY transcription factor 4 [Bidens hawaiensis]|uniref:putative WRKY transcription factor 4 n=1 Tax=Bidens hawaiensis TaxID=980011 RepID=UPI00404952AF